MNLLVLVALVCLMAVTYVMAPNDLKVSVTFGVTYVVYTIASIITKKYQKKYYTMTDSFAVSGQPSMSHKNAHPAIRANA